MHTSCCTQQLYNNKPMAVVALPMFSLQAILIFILLLCRPLKVSSGLIVQSIMVLPKHDGWWAVLYSSPCAGQLFNKAMAAAMLPLFSWWSIWYNSFVFVVIKSSLTSYLWLCHVRAKTVLAVLHAHCVLFCFPLMVRLCRCFITSTGPAAVVFTQTK